MKTEKTMIRSLFLSVTLLFAEVSFATAYTTTVVANQQETLSTAVKKNELKPFAPIRTGKDDKGGKGSNASGSKGPNWGSGH